MSDGASILRDLMDRLSASGRRVLARLTSLPLLAAPTRVGWLREIPVHMAVYCGLPAATNAFRIAGGGAARPQTAGLTPRTA